MNLQQLPLRRSANIASVASDDRAVILNLDDLAAAPQVLNDVAAEIWSRIDGHRGLDRLVLDVSAFYDIPPEEADSAVRTLVDQLSRSGFLRSA